MRWICLLGLIGVLAACATSRDRHTLAELREVEPQLEEIDLTDSLDKAMYGYRQFLQETPVNHKTPEALRRLADLQIEKEYGTVVGSGRSGDTFVELPAPTAGTGPELETRVETGKIADLTETQDAFEARTTQMDQVAGSDSSAAPFLPGGEPVASNPNSSRAIETYQRILREYPYYERNDQVLYQMARAYDELGQTTQAMEVMERLIAEYPNSGYRDEVFFRRAEYFFIHKKYLDAEEAYTAIINRGPDSAFHELALYKLGWTLYKQDFYEEALHKYMALLDYKQSIGYDFDNSGEEEAERRVADTFRVISLGFSNLGGPEVLNEYFSTYGHRNFEDRIYSNLAEFYVTKRRYNDAAVVYQSFVELNPLHKVAPHYSMRVAEIYTEGGFPKLVVESKKDFSRRYGLQAEYWKHYDVEAMPEVLSYLKTNLKDLAQHYHALYQEKTLKEHQAENYAEALQWYREFLTSFPQDEASPAINYQLADLHLEQKEFAVAAREYERTAYDYPAHEQSAAAGYAAIFAHREDLARVDETGHTAAMRATVDSSLRFANTFPDHKHAATVLGAATDDLYAMQDYEAVISAGLQLIERYPDSDKGLRRKAWTAVSHSYFELARYPEAEHGYSEVLALTPDEDESRQALYENLAASIYKQGELANQAEEFAVAADHFLRIKQVAPTSEIRPAAEYDAAVALISIQDWGRSAEVLRDFRSTHTDNELQPEVTKQLAYVYRQAGELGRSADEYRQVAKNTDDPKMRSESMLLAGDLYEKASDSDSALSIYREYVEAFPEPVEVNVETRYTIAGMLLAKQELNAYHKELKTIVKIDAAAGPQRTDRTRYLGARSALVLAELTYDHFASMKLVLPFKKSLTEKQKRMDAAMASLEQLVDYEVGEVTAAATFYIAEMYRNFSNALIDSERPGGMSAAELEDYNLVLEEEAYPFEERAIEVHQANMELMTSGTHNAWVEKSLTQLAQLMPGRYAKYEMSAGYIGAIDFYAYRSPSVDILTAQAAIDAAPADEAAVAVHQVAPSHASEDDHRDNLEVSGAL